MHEENRLKLRDGFTVKTFLGEFGIHCVDSNLVELVDCHGYVDESVRFSDIFGYSGKDLTVVYLQHYVDFQVVEHLIDYLNQLSFIKE